MAKYTVTRSCGHDEVVNLIGPHKNREWRLENVEPHKLCYECYQRELAEKREKDNVEAAEAAKDMKLPVLTGSEKQITWAETLRQQLISRIEQEIYVERDKTISMEAIEALESIKNTRTEARWWIDHRHLNGSGWSYEIETLLSKEYEVISNKRLVPAEVVADAKVEATVRPEKPVTETVAEIRTLDNGIQIVFPEKREDFREIVKKQLKMEWEGSWKRKLISKNGTPADRAAEAGHRLLAAGFPIRIYDEAIRQAAIAGTYETECTRWIQLRTGEKYKGWLAISWDRSDDFYKVAKRLPGARWSSPSMVVPVENFEEVLDFAKIYGFKVSEMAFGAIDQAKKIKKATLVVNVDAPEKRERFIAAGKPPTLEVPGEVVVLDEFAD
jgi:hypothetical protein